MRHWISILLLAIWVSMLWGVLGVMIGNLVPSAPLWLIKVIVASGFLSMYLYFWLKEEW